MWVDFSGYGRLKGQLGKVFEALEKRKATDVEFALLLMIRSSPMTLEVINMGYGNDRNLNRWVKGQEDLIENGFTEKKRPRPRKVFSPDPKTVKELQMALAGYEDGLRLTSPVGVYIHDSAGRKPCFMTIKHRGRM